MERELRFIIRFRNASRQAFRRLQRDLGRAAKESRVVSRGLAAVAAGLRAVAVAGKTAFRGALVGLRSVGAVLARARTLLTSFGTALAAIGIGVGLAATVSTLAEFEFALARVQAITGETGIGLQALEETIRELGATTIFTARQAADAARLLGQAGFAATEIVQALPGTLNLAVAGAIDLASAADLVAANVRGFNLSAREANRVADVLAKVSTSANTNVLELGQGLKFVAAVATQTGISIEESAAAIGALSDAGLKGTIAGTGLRRVLVGLQAVTPKGEKALDRLGLTVDGVRERLTGPNGLNAVVQDLAERQIGVTEAFDLFGLRGGPTILTLARMAERFGSLTAAAEASRGEAQRIADIIGDTLQVDLLRLRSALEELILQQGNFRDGFRGIIQTTTGVIQALNGTLNPLDENAERYQDIADQVLEFVNAAKDVGTVIKNVTVPVLKALAFISRQVIAETARLSQAFNFAVDAARRFTPVGRLLGLVFGEADEGARRAERSLSLLNERLEDSSKLIADIGDVEFEENLIEALPLVETRIERIEQAAENARRKLEETTDPVQVRALEMALAAANQELAELEGLAERGRAAQDRLDRIRQTTEQVANEFDALGERFNAAVAELGTGAIETSLEDTRFQISQLSLGEGAAADVQRAVNEAVRAAGLQEVAPEALRTQIASIDELIEKNQERLRQADQLDQAEVDAISVAIEGLRRRREEVTGLIDDRRGLRAELVAQITELEQLRQAQKAQGDEAKDLQEGLKRGLTTITDELNRAFREGEFNARRFFASLLQQISSRALQNAISNLSQSLAGIAGGEGGGGLSLSNIFSAPGSASGGGNGGGSSSAGAFGQILGVVSGLFSKGGFAERPPATAIVPAAAFRDARRFQFGGAVTGQDTIPALLRPGERVLTPEEQAAGAGITVNFNFPRGTDVDAFKRSQGQIGAQVAATIQRAQRRNL